VEFPGDEVNLNAIASTLANLTSEDTLEAAGAREIYGLGTAARRIQFRVGAEIYGLEIGADTPVGGNVYVAREVARDVTPEAEQNEVFTIASFRASSLNRDLDSLRDRRVLSFDRTRVNRISLGWPGGGVSLEKLAAGWTIVDPVGSSGPADEKAVDDLLSDVAFLRAESFVDEDQSAFFESETQASEPYFSLRLGLEEGQEDQEGEGTSLEAGIRVNPDPGGGDFVVRGGHTRVLYRVPRSRIEAFPRDVFSYRFKELSNFETSRVQSFELVFASEAEASSMESVTARVDRIENGWRAAGEEWVVGAAAGLIAEFARLEAVSVVAESADDETLASLGLLPPRVTLRAYAAPAEHDVEDEDEAEAKDEDEDEAKKDEARDKATDDAGPVGESRELLAEVSLGSFDPDSGIYARADGQAAIFRLDAGLAEQIPVGLDAYRSRFLAPPSAEVDGEPSAQPPPELRQE
ncbi:MAG: DUF4340 domain-containing protein, partial [Deltaproteobacteria bacterium]|nr:DUF4340 domain-containing protein [Deltaproteobacteria bacterium]